MFQSVDQVIKINSNINRATSNKNILFDELVKLKEDILEEKESNFFDNFLNKSIPNILDSIKRSIEKQTGEGSKPTNIGFSTLVAERLKRYKWNNELKIDLNRIKKEETFNFGIIPNKGQAKIRASIKVLGEEEKYSSSGPFTQANISNRRELIKKINNFSVDKFKNIDELFSQDEKQMDIDSFIDEIIKKHNQILIETPSGKLRSYTPSDGEKAILSISGVLENRQHSILVFDEIERGLGNKYISEYLIPKLKKLRDSGKMLILSTHNANIAINKLPTQTIFCSYNNFDEENIYYEGNMYANRLTSHTTSLTWEKEALINLEGSETMFGTRRDIYGL